MQKKTYKNGSQKDEENCCLQVVRIRCLLQNWNHPSLRQMVWKGLHETKMERSWKKPSKIERQYINFNFPRKMLILLNQTSKQGHYWIILGNETSIKVGKSNKTFDISNRSWSSPINNGLNLMRIHSNAILKNDVIQKFHFRLMEFTFLQFGVKFNFPKLFQNKTYMAFVVLHVLQENEDVIDVANKKIIWISWKTSFLKSWKTIGALVRPNGITTYSKWL